MDDARRCRLHLRHQILPGPRLEDDARDLVRFCRHHGVEEVVLYVTGEEWNTGFMTERQCAVWLEAIAREREILAAEGLSVSLNLYLTVSHADKGRRFSAEHPFEPMVSPSGREAKAVASWACPRWRAYIANQYARFARLGFRVLWLEDDARYRNHQPLDWGGDFSPSMLRRFSGAVGETVDRSAVLAAVLAPGEPHPWRGSWFETWNAAMAEALAAVRDAVRDSAAAAGHPDTMVGLMSGPIEYHWAEGRDWRRLFDAISIDGRAVHRPGFIHWGFEPSHQAETYAWLDMNRAIRSPGVTVEPDVECGDYSRWSHPDAQVWWHMVAAQLFGADALLLNLFPIAGNPLLEVDAAEIGELLDRSRPTLDWVAERFPASLATRGVGVPWSLAYARHVRTAAGWDEAAARAARPGLAGGHPLDQLDARISPAAVLLPQLGIAVQMSRSAIANAVFGAHAWSFSDDEIRELLGCGLWLDAAAAAILAERGYGAALGVRLCGWLEREESTYGMERVELPACGLRPGFLMRRIDFARVAVLEPLAGTEEWTSLIDATGARIGAGLAVSRPARGGLVAVSAFPLEPGSHTGLVRSSALATLVRSLVAALRCPAGDGPVTVTGGQHLLPLELTGDQRRIVVVQNGSLDPQRPVVRLPGCRAIAEAHLLRPLEPPRRTRPRLRRDAEAIVAELPDELPYLGFCVLVAE